MSTPSSSTREAHSQHVVAFDMLNIFACISVVALHVNGIVWQFSYDRIWLTSMIVQVVCYWAVPVFVMLTGATLMDYRKRYDTRTFFKKRATKTILPFFVWSLIGITYYSAKGTFPWGEIATPIDLINRILTSKVVSIYWFFPLIWGLYLCIPALSLVPEDARPRCFGYMASTSFIVVSVMPQVAKITGIAWPLRFPLDAGYVIYLLLGYLATRITPSKRQVHILFAIGVTMAVLMYVGEVYVSYKAGNAVVYWRGYTNFPCVLMAVAVFAAVFYRDWSGLSGRAVSVLKAISSASFGVYLIHYFLLDTVNALAVPTTSWVWRTGGILIIYGTSLLITLLIKRVPGIRHIVP